MNLTARGTARAVAILCVVASMAVSWAPVARSESTGVSPDTNPFRERLAALHDAAPTTRQAEDTRPVADSPIALPFIRPTIGDVSDVGAAQQRLAVYEYDYLRRAYEWHHWSTVIVFLIVVLMVLAGLWFSYLQFRMTLRGLEGGRDSNPTRTEPQGAGEPLMHEASLSPEGLRVRSTVLGVIILALSMGFFFLYLVHVYPLKPIG